MLRGPSQEEVTPQQGSKEEEDEPAGGEGQGKGVQGAFREPTMSHSLWLGLGYR